MKPVRAISRCEVSGKVYLPGDTFSVTQEQYDFLKSHGAVADNAARAVSLDLPSDATIATADAQYQRQTGVPRPKKGNRK